MASQTSAASEESQQINAGKKSAKICPFPFHQLIMICIVSEIAAPVVGSRVSSRHSCQLPMTRVKNIIKSDPEISLTSTEATLIIAKVDLPCNHYQFGQIPDSIAIDRVIDQQVLFVRSGDIIY